MNHDHLPLQRRIVRQDMPSKMSSARQTKLPSQSDSNAAQMKRRLERAYEKEKKKKIH